MGNGDDNNEIGILPVDHGIGEAGHNRPGWEVPIGDPASGNSRIREIVLSISAAKDFPSPGIRDS